MIIEQYYTFLEIYPRLFSLFKYIFMNIYEKIKEARLRLGLNQSEFSNELGLLQKDVSKVENGQRKFIPNRYFEYFFEKGFDINSFYNDEIPLQKISNKLDFLMESMPSYKMTPDEPLLNTLKNSLSFHRKEQVIDLFDRFNENGQTKVDLFELQIIAHWERHYLAEFQQMQRDIKELRDLLREMSKQNNP